MANLKFSEEWLKGKPIRIPLLSKQLGDEQRKWMIRLSKDKTNDWYDQWNNCWLTLLYSIHGTIVGASASWPPELRICLLGLKLWQHYRDELYHLSKTITPINFQNKPENLIFCLTFFSETLTSETFMEVLYVENKFKWHASFHGIILIPHFRNTTEGSISHDLILTY